MQLVSRRLHDELRWGIVGQVQRDLMRGTGRGGCKRAGPAHLYRSMQMPAEDALDLGVSADNGFEGVCISQTDLVHVADEGFEWRVMHDDDGRTIRCGGQLVD